MRRFWRTASVLVVSIAGLGLTPAIPAALAHPTTRSAGSDVDLLAAGAVCDGVHDDADALSRAIQTVAQSGGGTVWVPAGKCRIVATSARPTINIPSGVTISGVSHRSQLTFVSDDPTSYRQLFTVAGDDVAVRLLHIVRYADSYGAFFGVQSSSGFSMTDVTMDGQKYSASGREIDGIILQPEALGRISDVSLHHIAIKHVDYGLFQPSSALGSTEGVRVDSSRFAGNWADDLEFNAPAALMSDVSVVRSSFSNHRTPLADVGAGFAIGLAHVNGAQLVRNSFRGYRLDPIHVEDRSRAILIDHNHFAHAGTGETNYASHVLVVGAVHDVYVTHNTFDVTGNHNAHLDCVYLGGGGLDVAPDNVLVANNVFALVPNSAAVGRYPATHVRLHGNKILRVAVGG